VVADAYTDASGRCGIGFNRVLAVTELMNFLRQQQRFASSPKVA